MKAIGYCRCSTSEQADSGLGLSAQAERIKAYCTMKGLYLADIITDPGVSGGKPLADRDGGQRLLDAVKDRRVKAVCMLKLDRGFRNAGDCLNTVGQWDKAGISLHVVDFGGAAVDTSSATGRLLFGITALFAEFELNQTRERTRSALAVKRNAGERIGAIPYGFELDRGECLRHRQPDDPDDRQPCRCRLVENAAEQAIVAEIRSMRAGGMRLQAIARTLSARGVPTKTGRSGEWSHQAVARILKRLPNGVRRS